MSATPRRERRAAKSHRPVVDLVDRWRAQLTAAGYPLERLIADIDEAASHSMPPSDRLDSAALALVLDEVLGPDDRLAEKKVFDRSDVIVAVAPYLHGLPVSELDSAVTAVIADQSVSRC